MMNTLNTICKTAAALLLAAMLIALAGCDNGDDPTAEETALKTLKSKTWQVKSVMIDGVDNTASYAGMTISFTDNIVTVVNGGEVWVSQNTWQFASAQAKAILRGDGVEVELITLTASALVVKLSWNKTTYAPGGRIASTAGEYVFSFE